MKKLKRNLLFLVFNAWKLYKKYFLITTTNNILKAFVPLVNIIGLGAVVNALVMNENYENVLRIIIIFLSINLGLLVIKEIINLIELYSMRIASNSAQYAWSEDIVNINYHYAQDGSIQDLRMKSMGAHPAFYLHYFGSLISCIFQFAGVISILFLLSPLFIFIIAVTSALSIILLFKTKKSEFVFQNEIIEEDRKIDYLYKVMTEYDFAKEVRINNAESYISNKYSYVLQKQSNKLKNLYNKFIRINSLSMIITVMQTIVMYFYFSYQVFHNQMSIAEYIILLGAATLLASLLIEFFDNIAAIGRICERISFFKDYRKFMKNHSSIIASNKNDEIDIDFTDAVIKYENVSFIYPGTNKEALKNIKFDLKKGEKIGIVGLNGSGKTTLVKLLTRVYDPTEGLITINGIDIKEIPYQQYTKHFGVVLQDFLLFAYSVKENIILDTEYDDAKFQSCIEKSGLTDKIFSLRKGIETYIYKTLASDGIEFSGGEGQKLAVARAIYKNAETLVLDEPTSTLDPIAEYELFSKLNDISENKTTIFISHRLSSTKFCDRIIVLSNGEIIEIGSHDELIKQNGFYADLFNLQARYYREMAVSNS